MKSPLPLPRPEDHLSYQLHRKQVWQQILFPIILAILIFIAVIVLTSIATFRNNGEVGRWAAMSEIWLVIPLIIIGLILLALLIGIIYLLMRLTNLIPPYSYQAQVIFHRIESGAKTIEKIAHKPVILFQDLGEVIKTAIKKAQERM